MLRRSKMIILPRENRIREMMAKTDGQSNLATLLSSLKPEQRLVNILFDENVCETLYGWACVWNGR